VRFSPVILLFQPLGAQRAGKVALPTGSPHKYYPTEFDLASRRPLGLESGWAREELNEANFGSFSSYDSFFLAAAGDG